MVRLKQVAEAQGNREVAQTCENQMKRYLIERDRISDRKRW